MKYKILNSNALKLIAALTMVIDHIGVVFFPNEIAFRVIGRISFPIFAYLIAEGYSYTKSKNKYFLRLLILAIVSQVPYSLALGFDLFQLNILFTFLLAFCLIFAHDKLIKNNKNGQSDFIDKLIFSFTLFIILFITLILRVDYDIYGILVVFLFYLLKNKPIINYLVFTGLTILFSLPNYFSSASVAWGLLQVCSVLSLPLIEMYSGERGKFKMKYFFYVFYVGHLIALYVLKLLI